MSSKAEKRARRLQHHARRVIEQHEEVGLRAAQLIQQMGKELEMLREVRERYRTVLFGTMMARGLEAQGGPPEEKMSDALMKAWPEWFKGKESEPWMALSQQS